MDDVTQEILGTRKVDRRNEVSIDIPIPIGLRQDRLTLTQGVPSSLYKTP